MKYALGQLIYYMMCGRPHSAPVLARMLVENAHDDWAHTKEQRDTFTPFGESRVVYGTCHGCINEKDAFLSKQELFDHL